MKQQTKKQHYVPRLLLRNFCFKNTQKVYVFDKEKEINFISNITNILHENNFYSLQLLGKETCIEEFFIPLETQASPIIQKILTDESLINLTNNDIICLSKFSIIQMFRTKYAIESYMHISREFLRKAKKIIKSNHNLNPIDSCLPDEVDYNSAKIGTMTMVIEMCEKFVPRLLDMDWLLFSTTSQFPFWISDNPVTLHNDHTFGPYGNLGICVPGIQLSIPLSPKFTLCIWDKKNISDMFRYSILKPNKNNNVDRILNGYMTKMPISCSPDNVIFYNSLQVVFSERFLISDRKEWGLVENMISEDKRYKKGLRSQFI